MISSSLFFVVFRFYFRRFPRIFFEIPSAFFRSFFFFFVFFWGALFRYRSIRAFVALFRYRSIRALGALFRYRSIRAFVALLPAAIRAFVALFRYRSIRALGARGCTSFTPGCILAPFQGAHFPPAKSTTPATRASIPHLHLWRGGGRQAGGEVQNNRLGGEVQNKRPRAAVQNKRNELINSSVLVYGRHAPPHAN